MVPYKKFELIEKIQANEGFFSNDKLVPEFKDCTDTKIRKNILKYVNVVKKDFFKDFKKLKMNGVYGDPLEIDLHNENSINDIVDEYDYIHWDKYDNTFILDFYVVVIDIEAINDPNKYTTDTLNDLTDANNVTYKKIEIVLEKMEKKYDKVDFWVHHDEMTAYQIRAKLKLNNMFGITIKDIGNESMIINPYDTSFGGMINKKPIVEGLTRYLVEADINLNYEYSNADDCRLVFITGINDDEKELPLWEHPILFQDHKGNNVVAVDMRKYVKITSDAIDKLASVVKDKGGYEYMLLRAMIMSDMKSEVYGSFAVLSKNIALAYSYWLSDSINSVVLLNPLEKSRLEVIIMHYANMLMVNGDIDSSAVETSKVKISKSKISLPMNVKAVGDIVDLLKHDVVEMDDLVANIKAGLNSPKSDMIDSNTLVNMLASSWFGPGGSESVMMGIESIPTWIAMLYSSSANKSYKRSRLATILEKHGRKIDLKEINKTMELYIKDRTLG